MDRHLSTPSRTSSSRTSSSTSSRALIRSLSRAGVLCAAAVLLVGCSGGSESGSSSSSGGESAGTGSHNEADVEFASGMIPHHEQALTMVDMARAHEDAGTELSPEFDELLDQIKAAQTPEIEEMTGWLEEWDEPLPQSDGMGHGMGGDMGGGMDGDDDGGNGKDRDDMHGGGMMGAEDFEELRNAPMRSFEDMWLQMMIEHHEGAIEMSEEELDEGKHEGALALAESIATSQAEEIDTMEKMLKR